jgi:hypothetical protein
MALFGADPVECDLAQFSFHLPMAYSVSAPAAKTENKFSEKRIPARRIDEVFSSEIILQIHWILPAGGFGQAAFLHQDGGPVFHRPAEDSMPYQTNRAPI